MADFTHCHLWRTDTVPVDELNKLEVVKTFLDDSHLIRRVKRCRDCGQLYFYEFYEVIDWDEGKDPQYRTLIPVGSIAEARKLAKCNLFEVVTYAPRLQWASGRQSHCVGMVDGEPRYSDEPQVPHWVRWGSESG